ncbi:MAG: hypothetical protein N3A38_10165 [Planctomycetota bacterium]|nr:hypothetical protein [Planctomycetota bacterium]
MSWRPRLAMWGREVSVWCEPVASPVRVVGAAVREEGAEGYAQACRRSYLKDA